MSLKKSRKRNRKLHVNDSLLTKINQLPLNHSKLTNHLKMHQSKSHLLILHQQKVFKYNCQTNKIMIVDDEPMNIKGLQIMLKVKADIQEDLIFTASNGIEAVDLFKQSLKSINQIKLIFMDINMPLLDGIEATKQIRQLESKCKNQKRVSICAYTCWTDLQTKIKCSQAGMDSYFSKPITHDQLIVALNRYYFNQ